MARLATRQHGVVSRSQLLACGLTRHQIDAALRAGRLHPVHRGVYAVGHRALGRRAWWQAALLTCGEESALAGSTAGQAWSLIGGPLHPVHIATRTAGGRSRDRVAVHRTVLEAFEVTTLDGMRLTTAARTIVDLAGSLDGRRLRGLIERAQDLGRFHPPPIAASLRRSPRAKGRRALLDLLELMEPARDGTRSHLERLFLRIARAAGAPDPEVNASIEGRRRDFAFPRSRLVVEVDGYAYHSSREAMTRDRRRDRELTAEGWRPVRFTYEDISLEPRRVGRELIALIETGPAAGG
ncbi:MAG: type IV toxin-antitoxin system AbiEi family antitoxin domain-containing protein [Solirubrobacterales bacterium]